MTRPGDVSGALRGLGTGQAVRTRPQDFPTRVRGCQLQPERQAEAKANQTQLTERQCSGSTTRGRVQLSSCQSRAGSERVLLTQCIKDIESAELVNTGEKNEFLQF